MDKKEITYEDIIIDNYIQKLSSANHLIAILEVENKLLNQKIAKMENDIKNKEEEYKE